MLREQLDIEATIGPLIHIARTGDHDEYVFLAHIDHRSPLREPHPPSDVPAPHGYCWNRIELTPAAVHAANFTPKEIGTFFAGHLRHGQPPWTLPDVRSRPAPSRRHHKTT